MKPVSLSSPRLPRFTAFGVAATAFTILAVVLLITLFSNIDFGPSCQEQGGVVRSETDWTYHWGFNFMTGDYEYHFGPETHTWCELPG